MLVESQIIKLISHAPSCPTLTVKPLEDKTKMSLVNGFNPVLSSNEDKAWFFKVKGLLSLCDHLPLTIIPVREG